MLEETEIRVSSRKHGVHVRGFAECSDVMQVRKLLGDDTQRIEFDEERTSKPKAVLWSEKNMNGKRFRAGRWSRDKDIGLLNGDRLRLRAKDKVKDKRNIRRNR